MSGGEVVSLPSVEALHEAAVDVFVSAAAGAQRDGGLFNVVLSGGKTPESMYARLASSAIFRSKVDWPRVQFFWGDERHVPPDHPDSNYRMTRAALLDRVPIDPSRVWRIKGEAPDASQAAEEYERDLRRAFGLREGQVPRFDLVLLGMGPDGHTASLFPGTNALRERRRLVVANRVDTVGTERITLTVPALNSAAQVVFLVHGADKAGALKDVLEGPYDPERLPAQLIRPENGRLRWLVDPAASHLLTPNR